MPTKSFLARALFLALGLLALFPLALWLREDAVWVLLAAVFVYYAAVLIKRNW